MQPSKIQSSLTMLFAVTCGLSVANVYYAQPLLDAMANSFGINRAAVGVVVTATQLGCALALLLVVPLGDVLNRRRLILGQLLLLTAALAAAALSPTQAALLAAMVAVGLLGTAMTQGLIAFAATLAAPSERGHVVGTAQGGVVIGLLLARVMAGVLADLAGWRSVYLVSAALTLISASVLYRMLPHWSGERTALTYPQLLRSMFTLLAEEPALRIRGMIALLMFAAFSVFWTSMVLPLSAAPMSLSHTAIGAFGLVGVLGALSASGAGRLTDRGLGQCVTGFALILLLAAWFPIGLLNYSLLVLAVGVIALDLAGQALHVTNQGMILKTRSEAHSRLVACYMLFYSAGSGIGSITSTAVYAWFGWKGVCLLGAAISGAALVFWLLTRERMGEKAKCSVASAQYSPETCV